MHMHEVEARCTVRPHSVTGSEVVEVHWTDGEGKGSAASLLYASHIKQQCVVTQDHAFQRNSVVVLLHTVIRLISELGSCLNVRFSYVHSSCLVLGSDERTPHKRYPHMHGEWPCPQAYIGFGCCS